MNKTRCTVLGAAALLAVSNLASAEQETGSAAAGTTAKAVAIGSTLTATVDAIDRTNRTVTLKDAQGNTRTLQLGDEVRNFNQIVVGDTVTAEYYEALAVGLTEQQRDYPTRKETVTAELAALGTKPGGTVTRTITADAVVEAIDREARTVTVRGAERTLTLKVAEDIDLAGIEPGDEVRAVYSEAVAISVTSATPAETTPE